MIAERTRALGLKGKVAVSHAFCLGQVEPARLEQLVTLLLDNDIAIMSHAPSGPTLFPPLKLLHERGVRLFTGSDGVRDTWGPLNNGDLLERAYLIAYRSGFRHDADIDLALRMATFGGAQVMGLKGYGLQVGDAADLLLVEAETAAEAVCVPPGPTVGDQARSGGGAGWALPATCRSLSLHTRPSLRTVLWLAKARGHLVSAG
jgi:cytosine deaminase